MSGALLLAAGVEVADTVGFGAAEPRSADVSGVGGLSLADASSCATSATAGAGAGAGAGNAAGPGSVVAEAEVVSDDCSAAGAGREEMGVMAGRGDGADGAASATGEAVRLRGGCGLAGRGPEPGCSVREGAATAAAATAGGVGGVGGASGAAAATGAVGTGDVCASGMVRVRACLLRASARARGGRGAVGWVVFVWFV